MANMNYVTPGISKIDFEDNVFVTTELDKKYNKEVQEYIESRGGIVKGSVTKSTNYLIYGDGEQETTKYRKALELIREKGQGITILPFSLFEITFRGEGIMEIGTYPFETDGAVQPIKWVILKREGKKALLLSAYILDAELYNEKQEEVTWETCTLRNWLNEEFYNTAFSDEEQKRIRATKVKNANSSKYKTPGGNDTEDKIFLPSIGDVKKYMNHTLLERIRATPYAEKRGARNIFVPFYPPYWLRSPGYNSFDAAFILAGGAMDEMGKIVNSSSGICPAMWIDLE